MRNTEYSEKTMRRVQIWLELISKACDYLVVCEKYSQDLHSPELLKSGTYYIGDTKRSYFDNLVIEKGLSEAAVVAIASVLFGSGNGTKTIASDNDTQVSNIREILLHRTAIELNYSDYGEFEKYCKRLKKLRHTILAHYDAKTAKYRQNTISSSSKNEHEILTHITIESRKMASATLVLEEITELKNFSVALFLVLRKFLCEQMNPPDF